MTRYFTFIHKGTTCALVERNNICIRKYKAEGEGLLLAQLSNNRLALDMIKKRCPIVETSLGFMVAQSDISNPGEVKVVCGVQTLFPFVPYNPDNAMRVFLEAKGERIQTDPAKHGFKELITHGEGLLLTSMYNVLVLVAREVQYGCTDSKLITARMDSSLSAAKALDRCISSNRSKVSIPEDILISLKRLYEINLPNGQPNYTDPYDVLMVCQLLTEYNEKQLEFLITTMKVLNRESDQLIRALERVQKVVLT